jgi:hypothetical protein
MKSKKRGARGPRGARRTTGATGRRGKIGKPGRRGLKGLRGPLHEADVLDLLVTHFDDVYRQLNVQMKRIAKMEDQLDVMSATLGNRTER